MSEEAVEAQDNTTDQSTNDNNQENVSHETDKPRGYHPVDVSDLPEDKQKALNDRFGYFMGQIRELKTKDQQREKSFREWQDQTAKQIGDLTSGVGQIVDHIETRSFEESEQNLQREMKAAFEAGDVDKYTKIQKDLIDLGVKKATQKVEKPKEQPKNQTQQQAYAGESFPDAYAIAGEAVANGEITQEDLQYVGEWQNEKDAQGNLVRPWAYSSTPIPTPGSPMDTAMKEIVSMLQSPSYSKLSFQQILSEVDRRMGVKQNNPQNVLGGNLTRPQKTNTIKLSPEIERMAILKKFGGPKAKSDAEHVKAYADYMAKYKAKKGSR